MKNSTAKKLKQVPERYLIIGVDYLGLLPCLCANQKPVAKARLTLPKLNNICLPDGAVASWAGAEQEKKPPPVFSGVGVSSDGLPYILKAMS